MRMPSLPRLSASRTMQQLQWLPRVCVDPSAPIYTSFFFFFLYARGGVSVESERLYNQERIDVQQRGGPADTLDRQDGEVDDDNANAAVIGAAGLVKEGTDELLEGIVIWIVGVGVGTTNEVVASINGFEGHDVCSDWDESQKRSQIRGSVRENG